jgi:transposase
MLTLNFSEEEIQRLKYEKDFNPGARMRKRSHAVYLKMSHRMSNEQIGSLPCCHRNSVDGWIRSYQSGGLSSLLANHYCCPESELEQYKDAIPDNLNSFPVQSINEAVLRIEEACGVIRKPTQVRHFLLKEGYRYRKMGQVPGKSDAQKQEKWLDALQPYIQKARKGECHLLFSDAAHFTLSSFACMVWSICRLFLKTAAGRNRINVLGAVNAVSKEVITHINTTYITTETIVGFLQQLRDHYLDKPIAIVMDNARYQHCQIVLEKAKYLNMDILFLPPYSPNLNIIERLWKFTRKKVLYGKYYQSAELFHRAINEFFEQINQKYTEELGTILTLKFQIIKKQNAQNVAA